MQVLIRRLVPNVIYISLLCVAQNLSAATFVVDNTDQSTFGPFRQCTTAPNDCSWYGALQRAEATTEVDTIAFDIPSNDPGCGVTGCKVGLNTQTNVLLRPIEIDGFTQPGTERNSNPAPQGLNSVLKIEVTGNYTFQDSATLRGIAVYLSNITLGSNALAAYADIPRQYVLEGCYFGLPPSGVSGFSIGANPQIRFAPFPFGNAGTPFTQITSLFAGGTNPAQRNWFADALGGGGLYIEGNANASLQGPLQVNIEGNLFGTNKDATVARSQFPIFVRNIPRMGSQVVIGGISPAQRNVLGSKTAPIIDTSSGTFATNMQINPNIRVIGNYIGVAANGTSQLALNPDLPGQANNIRARGIIVGGTSPGEANLFAANVFVAAIESRDNFGSVSPITILGNTSLGATDSGAFHGGTIPNDVGDADSFGQNHPVIEGFSSLPNGQLEVRYRVDSTTANQSYPLLVEFYRAIGNAPAVLLGRDSYAAAEATNEKTVVLTMPIGVTVLPSDILLASATDASGSTSVFSWTPIALSFADNAPLLNNQPTPVRVRAVADGIFAPRGKVKIILEESSVLEQFCFATLVPTGFWQSSAQCNLTWTRGVTNGLQLRARFTPIGQPFASVTGSDLLATRTAAVIDDNLFCHGFEGNSNGSCRPLP
jgi:hypothetical protein